MKMEELLPHQPGLSSRFCCCNLASIATESHLFEGDSANHRGERRRTTCRERLARAPGAGGELHSEG